MWGYNENIIMTIVALASLGAATAHSASVVVRDPGLVSYTIVDDNSIPKSLTESLVTQQMAGNWQLTGRKAIAWRHAMPIPEQQFHGETAPSLYGVGNRLSAGELRLQIVNSKVTNEDTMMPSFYRTFGFNRPLRAL